MAKREHGLIAGDQYVRILERPAVNHSKNREIQLRFAFGYLLNFSCVVMSSLGSLSVKLHTFKGPESCRRLECT